MPQGDAIDIADYFSGLRRYRVFIAVVTLLSAVVAAVLALQAPRKYVASVTLAVSNAKFGDSPNEAGIVAPASFRPLFESRSSAAAVIKELGLDKAPYGLTPSAFSAPLVSIEELHATNLIKVTTSFSDPQRAAAIAQGLAEHAVELARKVNVDEATRAQKFINEQVGTAKARLEKAETEYRTYQEGAQVEALQKDIEATLKERSGVLNLLVKIESEKARLARFEEELSKRTRKDMLTKTIDSEPVLADALRDRPDSRQSILGMQLKAESISGVFELLDSNVATTRANLAGLEKEKAQLVDLRHLDGASLPQLSKLYARTVQLAHLLAERDLAQKIYAEVASRYEVARLQVGARSAQLEIIDPAVQPDLPEPRNLLRNVLFAGLAGLTASALFAMLLQAVSAAGRRA